MLIFYIMWSVFLYKMLNGFKIYNALLNTFEYLVTHKLNAVAQDWSTDKCNETKLLSYLPKLLVFII